jgi:hypothetical protein
MGTKVRTNENGTKASWGFMTIRKIVGQGIGGKECEVRPHKGQVSTMIIIRIW